MEPVTPQQNQSISVRKWASVAFGLTVVSVVVNGGNKFPLIDRLVAGVVLGLCAAAFIAVILGGWNLYKAKQRR